ncbi:MAG: hypothetical protein ABI442_07750 [Gemmatimonadaceae bacterium]
MSISTVALSSVTSPFSVNPVLNTSADPVAPTTPAKPKSQFRSDIATLINAVQSGDMTGAKAALTAVQNDMSAVKAGYSQQSTSSTQQLPPDLQNLFDAVQNGDATSAQSALTKLQSDAQANGSSAAGGVHGHHHHHHHADSDAGASSASTTTSTSSTSTTSDSTTPATTAA